MDDLKEIRITELEAERHLQDEANAIGISSQAMKEFEKLFSDWQTTYPNCDSLEMGGSGDLESLAKATLEWAARYLERLKVQNIKTE